MPQVSTSVRYRGQPAAKGLVTPKTLILNYQNHPQYANAMRGTGNKYLLKKTLEQSLSNRMSHLNHLTVISKSL